MNGHRLRRFHDTNINRYPISYLATIDNHSSVSSRETEQSNGLWSKLVKGWSMVKLFWQKIFRILTLIFIFGLLHTISQFRTRISVHIETPSEYQLPAISLCYNYNRDMINDISMSKKKVRVSSNLSLGEINRNLPSFEKFVQECKVLTVNGTYETCLSINRQPIGKYISFFSKCYTMFEFIEYTFQFDGQKSSSNWILHIVLNISQILTNKIAIHFSHATEEIGEFSWNPSFLYFDTKNNHPNTIVTFKQTIINRLPTPFDTKCFDYETLPCKNRATCIRRCIMEKSFEGSKAWVDRRYIRLDNVYLSGHFGLENETIYTEYCIKKYNNQPCHDYSYTVSSTPNFYSDIRSQDTFIINIAYPAAMQTIVQYKPDPDLWDSISDIVSLWYSLSVYTLFTSTYNWLRKFFHRQNSRN